MYLTWAVCPIYTNDLAISAQFLATCQYLLDIVCEYACKWTTKISSTNSRVIKLQLKQNVLHPVCHIGGAEIPYRQFVRHLETQDWN